MFKVGITFFIKHIFLTLFFIQISVLKLSIQISSLLDKCTQCMYTCGDIGKGRLNDIFNSKHYFMNEISFLIFSNSQYHICEMTINRNLCLGIFF